MISPSEGLHIFEQLLLRNPVQVGVVPINWDKHSLNLNGKSVQPMLKQLVKIKPEMTETASTHTILSQLKTISPDEQEGIISRHVQHQIIKILGFDATQSFDSQRALTDLGMDSLMAVELKNKVDSDFGVSVPLTYFIEEASVAGLSKKIHSQFGNGKKNGTPSVDQHGNNGKGDTTDTLDTEKARLLLENLDQLSDEQVDSLLDDLMTQEDA